MKTIWLTAVKSVAAAVVVLWAGPVPRAQVPGPKPPLKIEWRLGPDYPMGIQDSALGIVNGKIVSAGGFTRHPRNILSAHPDAFGGQKSGFTRLTFVWDPRNETAGWQRIADMPGPARQGPATAVVDDRLYIMGGINYTRPNTYRETYRLSFRAGKWEWEALPSARLPWPVYAASSGTAVLGKKIYLYGVADFFAPPGTKSPDFHSEAGRDGSPVGRALLVLDTARPEAGWTRLADCPGLPQFDTAVSAAGGQLYRLGGIYGPLNPGKGPHYFNAVDSWRYDPATNAWSRLADMPNGANRRAVAYADRYILLIAGYKYAETWVFGGTRKPVYTAEEKGPDWKAFFENTVLAYDTVTGQLTTADPLIERTSYPAATIDGDTVYCLGGEGGPRLWHPATFHIGKIHPANTR